MPSSEEALAIQSKLHREIPLSGPNHLNFQIMELSSLRTRAQLPLSGNTNHVGTLFGGSLFSAGALTCYSTLLGIFSRLNLSTKNIVITDSQIHYVSPGDGDAEFKVEVDPIEAQQIAEQLKSKGRAKASFKAKAFRDSRLILELTAHYKIVI